MVHVAIINRGWKMRRFIVAILCLILAAPIIAQVPTTANVTAQLAEQTAKRDEAERKLLIREAADELEAAQTEQAYNRFEIWTGILMGAFSVLITVLVIVFGFRTEKAAARAAQNEIAGAKAEIEILLKEARDAAAAAKVAQATLASTKAEADTLLSRTQSATAEAEDNAARSRKAAEIVENASKMSSAERAAIKLSPEQVKLVEAAAEKSAEKPEKYLTIDEYKTRIGKARLIDKDWDEELRLAQTMARHHAGDQEALAFALNAQGDAYLDLNCHDDAIAAYEKVIKRFGDTSDADLQQHLMWAMHHKGFSLNEQGRAAEAEAAFRLLLPLRERVDGAEHSGTLATRHELARAILNQGRAAEAEAELRAQLPLCERVDGAEHSRTLVTRHELARAILNQGRAAEAEAALHALMPLCERVDGAEHSGTLVTRNELARAMLDQGRAAEAEAALHALLPLHERVNGAEHRSTLVTRHLLACAILERGRAAEAEAAFRALLPVRERVAGAEHSGTLATRYCLAQAVFENDNAAEASATLVMIPDNPSETDWPQRHLAKLAFIRAKVADKLGNRGEAEDWFAKAAKHYAAAYPPDHYYRQQFDAYVAARPR